MTIRTVTKSLAGMEDLAAGIGNVVQQRGGTQVTVGKIDQAYAVLTEQDLADLDVTKFIYARLDGFNYEYDADDTSGVPSNVGPGSWIINRGGGFNGVNAAVNTGDSLVVEGIIWPIESDGSLVLGSQNTEVTVDATRFKVNTGSKVELLYFWHDGVALPSAPFTITNISDSGFSSYTFTIDGTDYDFTVGESYRLRTIGDLRGFGVVSDSSIDQTVPLKRYINYVDSRFYELDFLGYEIQTPDITAWTSTNGVVFRGLSFNNAHKLKNGLIKNPQNITLTNGWSCVNFTLYDPDGGQITFDNFVCDPYTPDFALTPGVGEEDGAMHAVAIRRNRVENTIPYVVDYGLDLSGLRIVSPAISYGVHSTIFMTRPINVNNLYGHFWGLLTNLYSTKLMGFNNVEAIFRDDIDSGSGRALVRNAIHCEPELSNIAGTVIDTEGFELKNVSCTKFSDGLPWSTFRVQPVNNAMHIKRISMENITGDIQTFASSPTAEDIVDLFESDGTLGRILLESFRFGEAKITNRTLLDTGYTADVFPGRISRTGNRFDSLTFNEGVVQDTLRLGGLPLTIGTMSLNSCSTDNGVDGAMRNPDTTISLLNIKDHKLEDSKLIEANVTTCFVDGLDIPQGVELRQTFFFRNSSNQTMYMTGVNSRGLQGGSESFIDFETAGANVAELNYCRFAEAPVISNVTTIRQFYQTP